MDYGAHWAAAKPMIVIDGSEDEGGAEADSTTLGFHLDPVRVGTYFFGIGTAGSTTLVAQALIPALILADAPSCVTLEGGMHNPMSPPLDFLARAILPVLCDMGV